MTQSGDSSQNKKEKKKDKKILCPRKAPVRGPRPGSTNKKGPLSEGVNKVLQTASMQRL